MTQDETTRIAQDTFVERVMAAIAVVPQPTPTRTFVTAIRRRSGRDAMAALSVAWHLGTERGWHIAPRVRARSMALVLAVVAVLGTGSLAAAAAVRTVAPQIVRAPEVQPLDSGAAGQRPDPDEQHDSQPAEPGGTTTRAGSAGPPLPEDKEPTPTPTPHAAKTDHADGGSTGTKPKDDPEQHGSTGGQPAEPPGDKGTDNAHQGDGKGSSGAHETAEPGDGDHGPSGGNSAAVGGGGHD